MDTVCSMATSISLALQGFESCFSTFAQGKFRYENLVEFLERKLGAESIFTNESPERLREIVKASQAEMKMKQKEDIGLER